jgi:amidase
MADGRCGKMKRVGKERSSYFYDKDLEPVLIVEPGEIFEVEAEDSFSAKLRGPEDFSLETIDWVENNLNPVTGPVFVEGAEPGDAVAVKIHDVTCTSVGAVIVSRLSYPSPFDWYAEPDEIRGLRIEGEYIYLNGETIVPISPFIGCVATAPARGVFPSHLEGTYGGNMDCPLVGKGSTLVLPVYVKGAKLFFGDAKAIQSWGEITQPPEVSISATLSVEVRKRSAPLNWPRIERPDAIMTLASKVPFELAAREAFKEMLDWMQEDYGWDRKDAAILMGMVADVKPCQISNTWYTAACIMPTSYLKHNSHN